CSESAQPPEAQLRTELSSIRITPIWAYRNIAALKPVKSLPLRSTSSKEVRNTAPLTLNTPEADEIVKTPSDDGTASTPKRTPNAPLSLFSSSTSPEWENVLLRIYSPEQMPVTKIAASRTPAPAGGGGCK